MIQGGPLADLHIRRFDPSDAEAAAQLFYSAVHQGARAYYSEDQRQAWAPKVPSMGKWAERLSSAITYVARHDHQLAGFMSLATGGYIDLAFVAPDFIGQGVAKQLYDVIEAKAAEIGAHRLYTHASHPARVFFVRQGWSVIKVQEVKKDNARLTNFIMEKHLNSRNK